MEPNRNEIKAMQGLSVLAMLCLHLFCRYNYSELYAPILFFDALPICFYLGQASDFCVTGFALCSGYALSIQFSRSSNCKEYYSGRVTSILRLICKFHVVLFVFSAISILVGKRECIPQSLSSFIGNLFLYNLSYNGAWWYLFTYVLIVFSSYPIIKWILTRSTYHTAPLWVALYFISYILRFDYGSSFWLIKQGYLYAMTLSQFSLGVYFFKHQVFSKSSCISLRFPIIRALLPLLAIATIYIRAHFLQTLFVAPISGILFLIAFHVFYHRNHIYQFFEFIGRHSTNIWLTHMFFYLYIFEGFIFIFHWPILIFVGMVFLTVVSSELLSYIQKPLCKKISINLPL